MSFQLKQKQESSFKTSSSLNYSSNPSDSENSFSNEQEKSNSQNSSYYSNNNNNNKYNNNYNDYKNPNPNYTNYKQKSDKLASNMKEFIANDKKGKSIHSKFLYLKRQLNLGHFMRKTQIDSLLKKCKSKAFKNIYEALRKCLSTRLGRLPQLFITNIKIDFNKHYLDRTILEIYQEFHLLKSFEDLVDKGYVLEGRKKILEDFLNLTFKQVYEYYINSHQFKKDYLQVYEREGQSFAILFSYIAQIFIQYYHKGRGNKRKSLTNKRRKDYGRERNSASSGSDFNDYEEEGREAEDDFNENDNNDDECNYEEDRYAEGENGNVKAYDYKETQKDKFEKEVSEKGDDYAAQEDQRSD